MLLAAAPAVGQKYAPLPKEIVDAKVIYVLNLTGEPDVRDFAYKELRGWKRYEITEDRDKAELFFVFTFSESADAGAIAIPLSTGAVIAVPTRRTFVTLRILNPEKPDDTALWQVTRRSPNGTKNCIKELRKRFPKN
ncbi:MAG: hypothetical protein L0Z53_25215 [Acidobacteriales bacterium]|nr:hypothetical protein [Terriglobales bacterium]